MTALRPRRRSPPQALVSGDEAVDGTVPRPAVAAASIDDIGNGVGPVVANLANPASAEQVSARSRRS